MPHKQIAIILAVMLAHPAGAAASPEDAGASMFSVHGFGTLGVVHSSEDQADFVANGIFQPDGAGHTHSWSPHVDSKLGLQLDATLTDSLSAVAQLVAESAYNNSWDDNINRRYVPSLEWAYLKYQFAPDFSVRIGRFALPTFLLSDYRKVGYALTTLRVPDALYGMIPMSSSDGVETSYRMHTGDMTHTVSGHYGHSKHFTTLARFKFKDQWGGFYTLENGALTGRISYNHAHVATLDPVTGVNPFAVIFQPTFGAFGAALAGIPGLEAIGAQAIDIANQYSVAVRTFKYLGLGASYDPGTWLMLAEWAQQKNSGPFHDERAWYVTAGYRIRAFTPYATYARVDVKFKSDAGLTVANLPPGQLQDTAAALNGLLFGVSHFSNYAQQNVALGARWDLHKSIALKAQYDHYSFPEGSSGYLINLQPGFQPGGHLSLFSVTLDFVF